MFHIEFGDYNFGMVVASHVYGPDAPKFIREPGILRIGPVSFSWGKYEGNGGPGAEIAIGPLMLAWNRY